MPGLEHTVSTCGDQESLLLRRTPRYLYVSTWASTLSLKMRGVSGNARGTLLIPRDYHVFTFLKI